MSIANHLVISRWADQIEDGPQTRLSMDGRSVEAIGDTVYSYGRHFPMAEIRRDRAGRPEYVLINGDTYSNTTSGHQSKVRGELRRFPHLANVIIPFTALDAAGIERSTLQPLEILPDTFEERDVVMSLARMRRSWLVREIPPAHAHEPGTESNGWRGEITSCPICKRAGRSECVGDGTLADTLNARHSPARFVHVNGRDPVPRNADGDYIVTTERHWLGESLIVATVRETIERAPTVAEMDAHLMLAAWRKRHEQLRATEDEARRVCGQLTPISGDPIWERASAAVNEAERVWRENLDAMPDGGNVQEVKSLRHGTYHIVREQIKRRARFLSAFDHNEPGMVYFLCELPAWSKAATVAEAFEDLKPPAVKAAEENGLKVRRQGDIFAIPAELPARMTHPAPYKRRALMHTTHTASEVIEPRAGVQFARGIMRHEPRAFGEQRRPDHVAIRLDGWHLIVRNTVPAARDNKRALREIARKVLREQRQIAA